ncbi:hypothetical protein K469DRAFT_703998 [Zopfia rhizophila CBS 207.26]|uniref:Uncharacterized protein n=1 Tax=Zopfia rhizophila CBS 207.26 TaxID=1314779 RepID=A0A6A6D705_9PEZI|nr:hypothetical protein K469DRAFT_703998 [Zopfia rhizophila CBS 207.26]
MEMLILLGIQGSPHWDNSFCKADPEETIEKAQVAKSVPILEYDLIYGKAGPLVGIWNKAAVVAV